MSLVPLLNLSLQLAGVTMLVLALGHFYLAKILGWHDDLKQLKPINQQVFFAHTLFVTGGIVLLGLSCLFFAQSMTVRSTLGAVASASFAMCWLSRLVCQFVVFKAPINDNSALDMTLRLTGTALWLGYTVLFAAVFAYQIGVFGN